MPKSRYWTQDEVDLLSEKWGTESVGTIAVRLGRSENLEEIKSEEASQSE